jgi:hypothetical protein
MDYFREWAGFQVTFHSICSLALVINGCMKTNFEGLMDHKSFLLHHMGSDSIETEIRLSYHTILGAFSQENYSLA